MLIAKEKKRTNIAEYILYMWQLEDILRALNFDLEEVSSKLVARFQADDDLKLEIYDWYKNLILMMQKEQITSKGHLQFLQNQVNDLFQFHLLLLQSPKDPRYQQLFQFAKPVLDEFREKSNLNEENDVHIALQSLYTIMLLGLKKKEITSETKQGMSHISSFIAHLSARYLKYEKGDFEL